MRGWGMVVFLVVAGLWWISGHQPQRPEWAPTPLPTGSWVVPASSTLPDCYPLIPTPTYAPPDCILHRR